MVIFAAARRVASVVHAPRDPKGRRGSGRSGAANTFHCEERDGRLN